jgi:HTH-type transcriptional regulator/antitoxin HigA
MEAQMEERRPAEVFHPGEYLRDELTERGWTQTEFAEIIERPLPMVNEIVNGKRGITPETAKEFAAALGTSPELWLSLDAAYHLWKTEPASPNIERRARIREKYPVREMIKRNWIQPSEDTEVLEARILRYFEIDSIDEPPELALRSAAKRSDSELEDLSSIQVAWLYRVRQIASAMQVSTYSKKKLIAALSQLKELREFAEDIQLIPQILEDSGIKFVIVEPLSGSKIDGVCFWLGNSPVIGMTLRYDRIDNFWFVLRHELEHVLKGEGKTEAVIDSDLGYEDDSEDLPLEERAANAAAAEFCVPQEALNNFLARKGRYISRKDVLGFARSLQVHPGLVVGQLQWKLQRFDLFRDFLESVREKIASVAMTDGYGESMPIGI